MCGFSLTFSALFTKTYRIVQIMENAKRFKRLKLTAIDVMKPMAVLLLINIIVLAVWTIIDPLYNELVVVEQDPFLRNVETYGICNSKHQTIFISVLGIINLGLLFYACLQAYRARKISTELQESSYIFTAMALILLVSFIGIPVIIIARENVSAYYFVSSGLIFVICASILLLIFAPKMKALRKKKLRRQSDTSGSRTSAISSTDNEGIRILDTGQGQAELEKEVANLKALLEKREQSAGEERHNSVQLDNKNAVLFDDDVSGPADHKLEEEITKSNSWESFQRIIKSN